MMVWIYITLWALFGILSWWAMVRYIDKELTVELGNESKDDSVNS